METKKPTIQQQIAQITGLKLWKVHLVFAKSTSNLHRVLDDEMAIILHAAADLGYENKGKGAHRKGKKDKEVTLEMVAKRAGVSQSVVTEALKKHATIGGISKSTRQHILNVVKELGYRPTFKHNLDDFLRGKNKS